MPHPPCAPRAMPSWRQALRSALLTAAVLLGLLGFLGLEPPATAQAKTLYVSDIFEITLRSGPSTGHKILAMLSSDTPLTVLGEEGDWLFVEADGKRGYVLKRYTMERLPYATQLERLKNSNQKMQTDAQQAISASEALAAENKDYKLSLDSLTAELSDLRTRFETLQADARGVIELKERYQEASQRLDALEAERERIAQENADLRSQSSIRWFLSGAGVVVISWLTGFAMGRSGRRRKSRLLM